MENRPTRYFAAAALACGLLAYSLPVSPAAAYDINNRWTSTKTDGSGLQRGDAITLLWSVVPDGEGWSRGSNSDVINALDIGWGVAAVDRVPDLTNRPWWSIMDRVYDQYTRVSGLTMIYEPEQNPDGSDTGSSGDMRIGGVPFTWENDKGGVLADNSFPNNGDMRIDTYLGSSGTPSWYISNGAPLRNLIAHESGHGIGLSHSDISGANAVMETPLETGFWGVQFDDIYAMNRLYGDPLEKNGGNDTMANASDMGNLGTSGSIDWGTDANNSVVAEMDDSWLGIDDDGDTDWFKFTTTDWAWTYIRVRPEGPTYSTNEQGSNTDFSARSDLKYEVYNTNGVKLMTVDQQEAGTAEEIDQMAIPAGDYFIKVNGEANLNQFYRLDVDVSTASYSPPADLGLVFTDTFDITNDPNGDASDINTNRFWFARQKSGVADSIYDTNAIGVDSAPGEALIDIQASRARFRTVSDGGATTESVNADLMRNFAPDLEGELWVLDVNIAMLVDAGIDASSGFSLVFDDDQSFLNVRDDQRVFALNVSGTGSVSAEVLGSIQATGTYDTSDLDVQLVIDESGDQPLLDVRLDGVLLLEDKAISPVALSRYFSLRMTQTATNPAGIAQEALLDDMTIRLNPFTDGDADTDGDVDADDLLLLGTNFGLTGMGWTLGDIDLSGVIDWDDVDLLELNYNDPSISFEQALINAGLVLAGDLDGDGFVGLADLDIILNNWNQAIPPGDPLADPTGDNFVGLADLDIVLNNWNAGTPPPATSIPEPATLSLWLLGAAGIMRRK